MRWGLAYNDEDPVWLDAYSVGVREERGTGAFAGRALVLTLASNKRAAAMDTDRAALAAALSAAQTVVVWCNDYWLPVVFAPEAADFDRTDAAIVLRFVRRGDWHGLAVEVAVTAPPCLATTTTTSSALLYTGVTWQPLDGPTSAITALESSAGVVVVAAGAAVWQLAGVTLLARGACASPVTCLAIAPNGTLYAGGGFGVNVWNGSSWATVGSVGMSPTDLCFDAAGVVWALAGTALKYWNGATWVAVAALAASCQRLVLGPDGNLYALGPICYRVSGAAAVAVGGPGQPVNAADWQADGRLVVAHSSGASVWNGANWQALPVYDAALAACANERGVDLVSADFGSQHWGSFGRVRGGVVFPGTLGVGGRTLTQLVRVGGQLVAGLGGSGTATLYQPRLALVDVPATAVLSPTLLLSHTQPQSVRFFCLAASDAALFFSNLLIANGETVTITGDGVIVSNVRGDLGYTLRAGSSPLRAGSLGAFWLNGDVVLNATLTTTPVYPTLEGLV